MDTANSFTWHHFGNGSNLEPFGPAPVFKTALTRGGLAPNSSFRHDGAMQLRLELPSLGMIGSNLEATILAWEQAESVLSQAAYRWVCADSEHSIQVSLDATTLKQNLSSLAKQLTEHDSFPEAALSRKLFVELQVSQLDGYGLYGMTLFLQELFLALNFVSPGACCLYNSRLRDGDELLPSPQACNEFFLNARSLQETWAWPLLGTLNFATTWKWLDHIGVRAQCLGETPCQRAVFTILNLSTRGFDHSDVEPENIVTLVRALEGLFFPEAQKAAIPSQFRDRIHAVLGSPESDKKWATQLYDLRSRIAHGAHPIVRAQVEIEVADHEPVTYRSEVARQLLDAMDRAFLVLFAVLRDMMVTNTAEYAFSASFRRIHDQAG